MTCRGRISMHDNHYPIVLFKPEETSEGTYYHPANKLAVTLCAIAGKRKIGDDIMSIIRQAFRVLEPNGQPLPFPANKVRELV